MVSRYIPVIKSPAQSKVLFDQIHFIQKLDRWSQRASLSVLKINGDLCPVIHLKNRYSHSYYKVPNVVFKTKGGHLFSLNLSSDMFNPSARMKRKLRQVNQDFTWQLEHQVDNLNWVYQNRQDLLLFVREQRRHRPIETSVLNRLHHSCRKIKHSRLFNRHQQNNALIRQLRRESNFVSSSYKQASNQNYATLTKRLDNLFHHADLEPLRFHQESIQTMDLMLHHLGQSLCKQSADYDFQE